MNPVRDMAGEGSTGGSIRAFVCVELPDDVVAEIAAQARTLATGSISPVQENNIHLTIAFLGEVKQSAVPEIERAMGGVSREPFRVRLGGLGSFGHGSPRVIFLSVEDGAVELSELHARLCSALEGAGIGCESRDFVPHLTLARVRASSGKAAGTRAQASLEGKHYEFTCNGMTLMQSVLGNGPPVHRRLFFRPFP